MGAWRIFSLLSH